MQRTMARVLLAAGVAATLMAGTACSSSASKANQASSSATSASSTSAPSSTSASASTPTGVSLKLLIGSSGDAETNALNDAAKAWGAKTGNTVTVIPAKDLTQELTQALAGGTPPDMFYVDASKFQSLVKAGALADVGEKVANSSDFYPSLQKSFTENGKYYCVPKDFSTLALEINTDLWTKAGLSDADIPTTWDQLEAVAKKLTTGGVTGLVVGDTLDRVGAFMHEAGGAIVSDDGKTITADSPENLAGLQYVQKLAKEGVLKFPKQVSAGWGGEAFGKGKAAMTIEGNWIVGAMKSDYANVKYKVVELPAGPKGKATLEFTNCWGVAAKSKNQAAAIDFIDYLTTPEQQLTFATDFGVMPSRAAAKDKFVADFPDQKAFVDGAAYAFGPVGFPGFAAAQAAFDAKVAGIGSSSDPKAMLSDLQKNATDALQNGG